MFLILKEFIADSGVLQVLPEVLSQLPIPSYMIFAIMFIFGSFISGATGIVAMGAPLAFAALSGMPALPLVILLNCINHAVTQLAPTHVCIVVAADYFKVELGEVIKKTVSINQEIAQSIRNENAQFASINSMAESNANDTTQVATQASVINDMVEEMSKLLKRE